MKSNFVTIIHSAFNEIRSKDGKEIIGFNDPELIALVNVGEREESEALEYAFSVTQNVEGSWSQGKLIKLPNGDTTRNFDYTSGVISVKSLPKIKGKTYGHRSTSVGDRMILDGDIYRVASIGFEVAWNGLVENDKYTTLGKRNSTPDLRNIKI